jgi:hypothetical protein
MAIEAVQHVRRMRGGAQAHLMRAADGHFYVVKFQNNPQHLKVLANEFLATRIAEYVGLPVPAAQVIQVNDWLIENTPDLSFEGPGRSLPCMAGLHFGARYVCDPFSGPVFDYLPEGMFGRVANRAAFAGVLALDKWLGNADGRQAVFFKKPGERDYQVAFVDQGYCFNAGEWNFPDLTLHGIYYRNYVYQHVSGWQSFEPWLSRIENFPARTMRQIAGEIPPEWCGGDWGALESLAEEVMARRPRVRELLTAFRHSSRSPFPNWGGEAELAATEAYLM